MTTLIGLSGSLREASFNTALLQAAAAMMPDGDTLDVETVAGVPLYNADMEAAEGVPERVETLKGKIAAADGLLLATPEYNNSLPGVFKNAVDWLSRPPADIKRVFAGKPVAVVGATPGGFGTGLAQTAWLPVFRTLQMQPWHGARLQVSKANTVFDDNGAVTDDTVRDQLAAFIIGFADFCRDHASRR